MEAIENETAYDGKKQELLKVGVHVLPKFPKDTTDRNRTAPFAFTGNKFEFRMLGSSDSVAEPNVVLNTAAAESLKQFADELEVADDFESALHNLIKRTIKEHKRIIFNGNCYDEAWVKEAERRGLCNFVSTPDALPHLVDNKNIELYAAHKIFTEAELNSRLEIMLENYCKILNIEALTMIDMAQKEILPAVSEYLLMLTRISSEVSKEFRTLKKQTFEYKTASSLISLKNKAQLKLEKLRTVSEKASQIEDTAERAVYYKNSVLPIMDSLRSYCDRMENLTADSYWPMPTYGDLLFGVK